MATNFEKFASTPEKVASLIDQFRCFEERGAARKSYEAFIDRRRHNGTVTTTELLTEWLKEESKA